MDLHGCVRSVHEQAYENIHVLYPILDTFTLASKKFHTFEFIFSFFGFPPW